MCIPIAKRGDRMAEPKARQIADELTAIKSVADALESLTPEQQRHVIDYVTEALGITTVHGGAAAPSRPPLTPAETPRIEARAPSRGQTDIRTLKDEKQPRSANEMAALVAYYISELLPAGERKDSITTGDIDKYFKQAPYPLPARVAQTLPNAASAGYFDSVGRGQWRLNPVGYNLVAHNMPTGSSETTASKRTTRRSSPAKRPAKKTPGRTRSRSGAAKTTKSSAKKSSSKRQ